MSMVVLKEAWPQKKKILNPLSCKFFAFQITGNGVTEEMRVDMFEGGVGVCNIGPFAGRLHDVVDAAQFKGLAMRPAKDRSLFGGSDQMSQVAQKLVIDNRHDAHLIAFAPHLEAFAFKIKVPDIQLGGFLAPQAGPEQRF